MDHRIDLARSRGRRRSHLAPVRDRSDEDLLARVREGDAEAYGEVYRRYEPIVRRFAASLLGRRATDDLDDVVADCFTRVLHAIENGKGPIDHPERYLMATVRTTVFAASRRRSTQIATAERLGADRTLWFEPAPLTEGSLVQAFRSLPDRSRRILWDTVIEGRDLGELADELGLSRNATAALAYRNRRALRRAYLERRHHDEIEPVAERGGAGPEGPAPHRRSIRTSAAQEPTTTCSSTS